MNFNEPTYLITAKQTADQNSYLADSNNWRQTPVIGKGAAKAKLQRRKKNKAAAQSRKRNR